MTERVVGAPRPVFLFDGDCGFCRKWASRLERITKDRIPVVPWQSVEIASLGVTAEACGQAVQFVEESGRVSSGAVAVARHLTRLSIPWGVAGALMLLPGVRHLAGAVYNWVARNRHRFRGDR